MQGVLCCVVAGSAKPKDPEGQTNKLASTVSPIIGSLCVLDVRKKKKMCAMLLTTPKKR